MMTIRRCALCSALALPMLGCAAQNHPDSVSPGVANAQPVAPTVQDQGRDVLVEADRQMRDLEAMRDSASDPFVRDDMDRQIEVMRQQSDRLLDDMTINDGRVHDVAIRTDAANLQRTMSAAASAEKQAEQQDPAMRR
jgi:hypothetical protein